MCMHPCMRVSGWHWAKMNRSLVSVLNAFLDLTGHVEAYRHASELYMYGSVFAFTVQSLKEPLCQSPITLIAYVCVKNTFLKGQSLDVSLLVKSALFILKC